VSQPAARGTGPGGPSLRFERLLLKANERAAGAPWLGGHWLGDSPGALPLPLLFPAGAVFDGWRSDADVGEPQQHGPAHYRSDGQWLYGWVEIDDRTIGLQAAAHQAYTALFEALEQSDCPHLLRLWNYFSGVNVETQGLERYRQFNMGRQEAFVRAQRSAFDGAPAACALGAQEGLLRVHFLAGRQVPRAIENPRQVSAYRYPPSYGPRAPTFSRAALVDVGDGRHALFISGTASIVGHASVHLGDVRRQTEETLANMGAVRDSAATATGLYWAAPDLCYTLYLRHAADLPVVRATFERAVGPDSSAARSAIYLLADICRSDLLIEIEAHGFQSTGTPP
jgi:chorismate lyase / 3-hydroxybenzoate synthase